LPGWQLFTGPNSQGLIGLNLFPLGIPYATIVSAGAAGATGSPVDGLFSLAFAPNVSFSGGARTFIPAFIEQTGDIPFGAQCIRFTSYGSPVELRINGSVVPLAYDYHTVSLVGGSVLVANVVGNISTFAGTTADLKFITLDSPNIYKYGLDSISF